MDVVNTKMDNFRAIDDHDNDYNIKHKHIEWYCSNRYLSIELFSFILVVQAAWRKWWKCDILQKRKK